MTLAELRELLVAEIGEQETERALAAMTKLCSGETIYIPRRAGAPEIGPEDTPATVQHRFGVSRATAYNWVSAYRRQR